MVAQAPTAIAAHLIMSEGKPGVGFPACRIAIPIPPVYDHGVHRALSEPMLAHSAEMSDSLQADARLDSFTGFGYRPLLTPAHHVDLETGNTFSTPSKRKKPLVGKCAVGTAVVFSLIACLLFLASYKFIGGRWCKNKRKNGAME